MILASFKLTLFRAKSIKKLVEIEVLIWNFDFLTVLVKLHKIMLYIKHLDT